MLLHSLLFIISLLLCYSVTVSLYHKLHIKSSYKKIDKYSRSNYNSIRMAPINIFDKVMNNQLLKSKSNDLKVINTTVAIVGAGMSGLSCAYHLSNNGITDYLVVESSDGVGGRVRSDDINGYRLDRGFQVFIDSYPEAKSLFQYDCLSLREFEPGALVRLNGDFHLVSDPIRRPADLQASLISPIGSFWDKAKVGLYSLLIRFESVDNIITRPERSTAEYLSSDIGLSQSMIRTFFTPFYQGIFLSPLKDQSSRMFEFVFKMFALGSATLPAAGLGAIPKQLASRLPKDSIMLNSSVTKLAANLTSPIDYPFALTITNTTSNEVLQINCNKVVVAADPVAAQRLINTINSDDTKKEEKLTIPKGRGSTCLYFGFDGHPPIKERILILNGEHSATIPSVDAGSDVSFRPVVNNVCFPSMLSKQYSPAGKSLASVTIVGTDSSIDPASGAVINKYSDEQLGSIVKDQLTEWWGPQVEKWELLKVYRIPYAQPAQLPHSTPYEVVKDGDYETETPGVYCVGDHRESPTLNGAIATGRKAADQIAQALSDNRDQ